MIKTKKSPTPGTRHKNLAFGSDITFGKPYKPLTRIKRKINGRNNTGKVTVRHRGGGEKRRLRFVDFKRDKRDIQGLVENLEYDPNRSANIALIKYSDGERRYIIAPTLLRVGMIVASGTNADIKPGNALPLKQIPIGTPIHNLELRPGKGGQLIRSAGSQAIVQSKEGAFATILMPSKEVRLVPLECYATIGQVSNPDRKTISLGKAGRRRHMGWRPTVRGTAQHPDSHPHGGGEGRSGVGLKQSKTPWGKPARGKITRRNHKYSDKFIVLSKRAKR